MTFMVRKEDTVTSRSQTQLPEGFLQRAREEASTFNHNYVGTEHLLLAGLGDPAFLELLATFGVEPERARSAVEFIVGRAEHLVRGEQLLTPRAEKVIELTIDEMRRLSHRQMQVWHILLGLVREGEGIAAGVLESLGVTLDKVRAEVRKKPLTFEEQRERSLAQLHLLRNEYVQLQKELSELDLTVPLEDLTDEQMRALKNLSWFFTNHRGNIGSVLAERPAGELFPTTPEERVLQKYVAALDARETLRRLQVSLPSKK